jgi:hypothetical protein
MAKLTEFTGSEHRSKISYVNKLWSFWSDVRTQTLSRLLNYLFALNTGALLASLTYVATKTITPSIQLSIWFFSAGIFCSVAHATIDYYVLENKFSEYCKDIDELYANKMHWEVFIDRSNKSAPLDTLLHILSWASGIAFFAGLVIGILGITESCLQV